MENSTYKYQPEIWGGAECTINRVGNDFLDQLEFAGHYDRSCDIDLFASLGIRRYRFPILWERHMPEKDSQPDFQSTEKKLLALYSHGIEPIAGLLHHGSGPVYTNLEDERFPEMLAQYAGLVAQRFPYIQYYTPVNEPVTTARFSGLYGHWYPHKRSDRSFARMLVNQVKGMVLSMKEIRKVNPDAQLIQTEDLGKTYSTPLLQYQADFENERRWLSYDLLCGKVNPSHTQWNYLLSCGIEKSELDFFMSNPCPPDIVGLNHYITSERFIDERVESYPAMCKGGNGKHVYVDIDAIRVPHKEPYGLANLLREAATRYQLPIAITEVQLNCHREQQLRWFNHIVNTCTELRKEGYDIRAVTAWALVGAYGWNKLVTVKKGDYECGVFDLNSGMPRPTALYHYIRTLTRKKEKEFSVLGEPGWWEMNNRFIIDNDKSEAPYIFSQSERTKPILIIGKTGTLGSAFARLCEERGLNHRLLSRTDIDIAEPQQVEDAIERYKPWAIINAAGYVRVDDAESDATRCFRENTKGPAILARSCNRQGIKFMTFSSDLVFNGDKKDPYLEADKVSPLSVYGKSKADAEREVIAACPGALIIRTSAFFGPWDKYNFVHNVLQSMKLREVFVAANDVIISPTYIPDLVHTSIDLMIDDEKETWHLSNTGDVTWSDLAKEVAMRRKFDANLINCQPVSSLNLKASRPQYSVLNSSKGVILPSLDNALDRFFANYIEQD